MNFNKLLILGAAVLAGGVLAYTQAKHTVTPAARKQAGTLQTVQGESGKMNDEKVTKTEEEWRKELSPEQYHILREKGTERAFTGKYWNLKENGSYECAGCGTELFKSDTKFDSHCGWPSFYDAPDKSKLKFHDDFSFGMHRVEVTCARCGGHLGHIFPDGPEPTGQRYCINSASLNFKKADDTKAK